MIILVTLWIKNVILNPELLIYFWMYEHFKYML